MTTKELIRAEIRKWQSIVKERCPESTRSRDYTKEEWNAIYEYNAYTRILSFLDTLEEPVSDCPDLTEAAEKYGSDYPAYNDDQFIAENAFKAGAEWQEKQDLRWAGEIHKNGYNLCKEQMMEGAVEGEICHNTGVDYLNYNIAKLDEYIFSRFKVGDKVKIIIVKEEEQ